MKRKRNTEKITDEVLCGEYNAVYRYVLSLCHDENLASDITQETFLKAMSTTKGFEGQSSLYTWLCAIAKRIFLNKCKKQGREVFEENYFDVEVKLVDCIEYVNQFINKVTTGCYKQMAKKAPWAWKKVYYSSQKGTLAKLSTSTNKLMAKKLHRLFKEFLPDIVISTHFFATQMTSYLKEHEVNFDTLAKYDRGVEWSSEQMIIKGQQWKAAYLPVWLYSYQEVKKDKQYNNKNTNWFDTIGKEEGLF